MTNTELARAGLVLMNQGDVQEAVDLVSAVMPDRPDSGELWELLGVAQHRLERFDEACEALETASLLKPLDVGARFCLAEAYAKSDQRDLAVFLFRMLGEDDGTPTWLLPRTASRLGELKEDEAALSVCVKILEREPQHHEARFGVGFYQRRLGYASEIVLAAFTVAHEMAPDVDLYRVSLAFLLEELDRIDEARELLRGLSPQVKLCPCAIQRIKKIFHKTLDLPRAEGATDATDEPRETHSVGVNRLPWWFRRG